MNKNISIDLIKEAVYNLCIQANNQYSQDLYELVLNKYNSCTNLEKKLKLQNILSNINLAFAEQRPLCQDTGQIVVFLEVGKDVCFDGNPVSAINYAVEKAYKENFFRKSVVENAIFSRVNTDTNTPVIVYTDYTDSYGITIKLMVKGAGSENYSKLKMFTPAAEKTDIFEFIHDVLLQAGEKGCPPYVIGLGIGGTMDYASVLSKKAFFNETISSDESSFLADLLIFLKDKGVDGNILDIKIATSSTHIACLPVAVTVNCHSTRHSSCTISNETVKYNQNGLNTISLEHSNITLTEIRTDEIEKIKSLKTGENVLLSGVIYTARDAAHARLFQMFSKKEKLPIELKDKIIFYAGPCPAAPNEPIGPIGPTTSARMDKYTDFIYGNGVIATIGKGERSTDATDSIIKHSGKYFTVQGGIACLLSKCVLSSEVVAFEELGTEAIRKLVVKNLPVSIQI